MTAAGERASRELRVAVGVCVLGAVLVLVGAGRGWTRVDVPAGPLTGATSVLLTGADLVPGVRALGLLGLAGVVALLATRRLGRPLVGAVVALAGAGAVLSVVLPDHAARSRSADQVAAASAGADDGSAGDGARGGGAVATTAWPAVTAVGGGLLLAGGLLAAARGRSWPGMGQRYEAPAARTASAEPTVEPTAGTSGTSDRGLWEALDRGEDPTDTLGASPGSRPRREGDSS